MKAKYSFIILIMLTFSVYSEKVLVYDEEKGITFVDSEELKGNKKKSSVTKKKSTPKAATTKKVKQVSKPKAKTDLHLNRKKDPPELYFKSGLKYYRDKNYKDALKNFKHASAKSLKPEYLLWIGKTYRKLKQVDQMIQVMNRIADDYSESAVADDALFELAFHYQKNNYYSKAIKVYTRLAEQYPFGLSYSNSDEFLEISRKERQRMRGEILSSLRGLGIKADNLEEGYSKFQKKNNLKVTGEGDSLTVSMIKTNYKEISQNQDNVSKSMLSLEENLKWAITSGILFSIIVIMMIIMLIRLTRFKHEITLMIETISDMRIGNR